VPGLGTFEGADAIRACWDNWKPAGLQRHMPVNVVITDWDAGQARATTDVVFIAQGDVGWSIQIVARYCDEFKLVDGKWLFSRRADPGRRSKTHEEPCRAVAGPSCPRRQPRKESTGSARSSR